MEPPSRIPNSADRADDNHAVTWHYELVPLLALPDLDLTVSMKTRFIRSKKVLRMITILNNSPLSFVGYVLYLVLCLALLFVPASTGQVIAILAALCGLPAVVSSTSTLRYEMIVVLAQTYDIWFFQFISALASVLLGLMYHDARALLPFMSWFLFTINVFTDASILAVRHVWFGNGLAAVIYLVNAACVSFATIDKLQDFDVLRTSSHALPATVIVRDGIISMLAVIARNLFRQHQSVVTKKSRAGSFRPTKLVTCVSFRCRLKLQAVNPSHRRGSRAMSTSRSSIGGARETTQLRFSPFLDLLDARDTLIPMSTWLGVHSKKQRMVCGGRLLLNTIGIFGFVAPNAIMVFRGNDAFFGSESSLSFLLIVAMVSSLLFIGVCLALCQRQLLRAVATSFDFIFITSQITLLLLAMADLCRWRLQLVGVLFINWSWSVWAMCWDGLHPIVRRRLGLSPRFAASISSALVAIMVANAVTMFVSSSTFTGSLNHHVIWRLNLWGHEIEFTALSWYFSCAANITTWSLRTIWRMWRAAENELVVLDGPVVYESQTRSRTRGVNPALPRPVEISRRPTPEMMPRAPPHGILPVPVVAHRGSK